MKTTDYSIAVSIPLDGFFLEDPDPQKKVDEYLRKIVEDEADDEDEVLVFDPETGELIVKSPLEKRNNPDAIIITSIARDGFF